MSWMPYDQQTRPRRVFDERLPDGRTVNEALAGLPVAGPNVFNPVTAAGTTPPPSGMGNIPTSMPSQIGVPTGGSTVGLSPLGKLLAERRALQNAPLSSNVIDEGNRFEITPPEQSPSRVRNAIAGALQGAALAGQANNGDPWATLGAAGTGAAAGAISPKLMQSFLRKQALDRQAGEIGQQMGIDAGVAKIQGTLADAAYTAIRPEIEMARIEQQEAESTARIGATDRATQQRGRAASTTAGIQNRTLEERARHNKAMEAKTVSTEEITVAGRTFKVTPSTAARILEARTTAINKPDKERVEAQLEAELEEEAAQDHLAKRKQADDQASALRAERELLTTGRGLETNKGRIAEIDRQIASAEKEAVYRQTEADNSFARKRKAQSKTGGGSPKGGKTFNLRQWKADNPGADPTPAIKFAKDNKLRIIDE